jgi:hypothetical protein
MTKFVSFKLPIAITVGFCSSEALGSQKYSCAYLAFRSEHREHKSALVKVVLCPRCLKKLMWKRNKEKDGQPATHATGSTGNHEDIPDKASDTNRLHRSTRRRDNRRRSHPSAGEVRDLARREIEGTTVPDVDDLHHLRHTLFISYRLCLYAN